MQGQSAHLQRGASPPTSDPLTRIGKHTLVYLPTILVPAVSGIVMVRVLTTLFDSTSYGWYNLAFSAIGLIKVFTAAWLVTSAVRFYAAYQNSPHVPFVSTLAYASLGSSLIVCGTALVFVHLLFQHPEHGGLLKVLTVAIIASVFTSLFEVLVVVFRAGLHAKKYALFWVLYTALKPSIGLAIILILHTGIEGAFWGFLLAPLLLFFPLFRQLEISFPSKPQYDPKLLRAFASYGFPLALTNLATWFLTLSDRYIIQYFRGATEVGYYAVGYAVPEKTLQFAFMTLMLAAYPVAVDHFERFGTVSTQRLITNLTRYFFLFCGPVFVLVVGLSGEFLLLLADAKFLSGARAIPLVAGAMFLAGLNQIAAKGFELYKQSLMIAKISLSAGLLNIVLNLALVPKLGYVGAATSALLSYAFMLAVNTISVRRYMSWNVPVGSLARNAVAAVLALMLLRASLPSGSALLVRLAFGIPVGVGAYYGVLLLLGELGRDDLARLQEFIRSVRGATGDA